MDRQRPNKPEGTANDSLPAVSDPAFSCIYDHRPGKDAQDLPVSGATVTTEFGQVGVTDVNGVYQVVVPTRPADVDCGKGCYDFEPEVADLDITKNMKQPELHRGLEGGSNLAGCCTQFDP